MDIESTLDTASGPITLWLPGHVLQSTRIVSWDRPSGTLVCRGGTGFTEEDVHHIRAAQILAITLRHPAPRNESDRLGPAIRDSLRQAAGYPVSLAIRPDAFLDAPAPLAAWLKNVVDAVALLDPYRDAMQSQVDQILLREGSATAVLGGSTLILEATPTAIPSPAELRAAIEPHLS